MVQIAITDNEKKVIGASYSYKKINWDQIKLANDNNLIKSTEDYLKYSDLNIVTINNKIKNINVPIKVPKLPGGFILIKKEIFNKFVINYPEQSYMDSESNQLKTVFFDFKIQKNSKLISYVGEEYMFCKYVEDMGESIWLLPWIKLSHVCQYTYESNNFNNLEFLEKEY